MPILQQCRHGLTQYAYNVVVSELKAALAIHDIDPVSIAIEPSTEDIDGNETNTFDPCAPGNRVSPFVRD